MSLSLDHEKSFAEDIGNDQQEFNARAVQALRSLAEAIESGSILPVEYSMTNDTENIGRMRKPCIITQSLSVKYKAPPR